jgi:hypothetical protein
MVAWAVLSPTDISFTHPYVFLLGCGFQFALMMGRIILAHLCDEHAGMRRAMWFALAPLPFAVANAASGACVQSAAGVRMRWLPPRWLALMSSSMSRHAASLRGGEPLVPEAWLLAANFCYGVWVYVSFAVVRAPRADAR